jgi:hypothetical protein
VIDFFYGTTCLTIVHLAITTRIVYNAEAEAERLKNPKWLLSWVSPEYREVSDWVCCATKAQNAMEYINMSGLQMRYIYISGIPTRTDQHHPRDREEQVVRSRTSPGLQCRNPPNEGTNPP